MAQVEVGTEYVYGIQYDDGRFTPMQCNTQHNPAHPCRVTPVKVGPKWSYALLSGSDKPKKIATDGLVPVEEAKRRYRIGFGSDHPRPEFVDQCVEGL